jgi:WD40 repeat protein
VIDEREIVRRAVERQILPEPAYERLLRRRDRKRRNERLTAGVVVIAVFVGAMWFLAERFSDRTPTPASRPKPGQNAAALAYGVDGDIYVADLDGSNPVRIADGVPVEGADECGQGERRAEYIAFGTAWSPDGRYLAYWDRGCPYGLPSVPPERGVPWGTVIISDAEGNVVASFPGQGWQISWSPDSKSVAISDFWSPGGSEGDATIGVYGLDGVRQAALTVPSELVPSGDYSPVWSRDGASLLLRGVQVPLDGRTPRRLPADDHWGDAYSPDGSHVAYTEKGSLVVAEADGSDAQKPGGPTEFWDAAWSPSGDRVAFVHDGTELRVRDVTTGTETSLLNASGSERLQVIEFSPDGDRILFSRAEDPGSGVGSLWSINADGSEPRRLVARIEWADWRPQSPTP